MPKKKRRILSEITGSREFQAVLKGMKNLKMSNEIRYT